MDNDLNLLETELVIDGTSGMHLKETAAWGKFLGIVGFIYSALLVLIAIFAATAFSKLSRQFGEAGVGNTLGGILAVFYLVAAGIVLFLSVHLYGFSKKSQVAIQTNDQVSLTDSFRHLKVYFRFAGILTAITMVFAALGIVGIIMTALFRG